MKSQAETSILPSEMPTQHGREILVEQILWLIRLRWIAVAGIIAVILVSRYAFSYSLVVSTYPLYVCAFILFLSNCIYYLLATKKASEAGPKDTVLGLIQVEIDLVIVTVVLHYSGGVVNPFFLFYIFHVIIATIILPRQLSLVLGLTSIFLFGALALNALKGGALFGYYPLQLQGTIEKDLWRNPVYVLGSFVAFVLMVMLTQYLTHMVIRRMTAKEMEAARNHDVLRAIISAMAEGLVFVTCDGRVAICNPAARLWKSNQEGEESSYDEFPGPLSDHIRNLLNNVGGADEGTIKINPVSEGSQERNIEVKSCPVAGISGSRIGYVIVGEDVTEHKRLERDLLERTEEVTEINEMLKMSRIEMAQREKMVAIGQMATGIAHEIGNPLASLSSVAQYLARKVETHEQKEQLLIIEHNVNRISNILKRMLSLARPATGDYKWVDVSELIDNTLSLINFDRRAKSVSIRNEPCPDLPTVWLNPQHFEQVIINVLINALDAMNAKGGDHEHVLGIRREFKDGMIEIRISDTGIGMKPEVCRRAFESFFTTKEIGKGTGLGLFISYNLVSEIDGTITMESEPGVGTTVIIRIPRRPKKHLIGGEDEVIN